MFMLFMAVEAGLRCLFRFGLCFGCRRRKAIIAGTVDYASMMAIKEIITNRRCSNNNKKKKKKKTLSVFFPSKEYIIKEVTVNYLFFFSSDYL